MVTITPAHLKLLQKLGDDDYLVILVRVLELEENCKFWDKKQVRKITGKSKHKINTLISQILPLKFLKKHPKNAKNGHGFGHGFLCEKPVFNSYENQYKSITYNYSLPCSNIDQIENFGHGFGHGKFEEKVDKKHGAIAQELNNKNSDLVVNCSENEQKDGFENIAGAISDNGETNDLAVNLELPPCSFPQTKNNIKRRRAFVPCADDLYVGINVTEVLGSSVLAGEDHVKKNRKEIHEVVRRYKNCFKIEYTFNDKKLLPSIHNALARGVTIKDMIMGVEGYAGNAWCMRKNPSPSLKYLIDDNDRLAHFISLNISNKISQDDNDKNHHVEQKHYKCSIEECNEIGKFTRNDSKPGILCDKHFDRHLYELANHTK